MTVTVRQQARLWRTIAILLMMAMTAGTAGADVNPMPIAVPLIGNSGAGSPYPSRIHVTPRGGALAVQPTIVLQKITHPCLQDLAVLLVHVGIETTLLMSHAGGCTPVKGADLIIDPTTTPLSEFGLPTVIDGLSLRIGLSNYGAVPSFPSPAPAGPYSGSLVSQPVAGDWELYVIDTNPGSRGVLAAGWSLNYPARYQANPLESLPQRIPASIVKGVPGTATIGPAGQYPLSFDFNGLPAGAKVRDLRMLVSLSHENSGDVNLILQGPSGSSLVLMANCGGPNALNSSILFVDGAPPLPSVSPIPGTTVNSPTTCFAPATPPSPGPTGPYLSGFPNFTSQDARGTWKLWVYDDTALFVGSIGNAQLTVGVDVPATMKINLPTTGTTYTATTPFLHVEAAISVAAGGTGFDPYSATWINNVGGKYYQSGPMTILPGTNIATADVPMQQGTNFVVAEVSDTVGVTVGDAIDVTVNEFVYTLSEGATGGFFDLDVTMANPTGGDAPVTVSFLPEHSAPIPFTTSVAANGVTPLRVNDLTPGDGVSTIVHSTAAVPLAVERTMSWDKSGYGGSGGTAIAPATQWLFAEGSQGYFDTFILLANDGGADANATVRFLIEGGSPVDVPMVVPAHKRVTVYAGDIAAVRNTSFGLDISADRPITAERSMYFPHDGARVWEGGHEAAGATATSTHWFLAEGATGPFFECFVLLSNPNTAVAHATLTYLLTDGTTIPQTVTVPANGRVTINVETVDSRLANTPASTTITSDIGIIVERSMYWPDISIGWREAHNSVGVTDAALRWAVADGRLGGARGYQTYILLANPNTTPAEVQLRFLKAGQAPIVKNYTLLPTSRLNIGPDITVPLLGDGVFSAEVQVLNYQPIVIEKALYWNSGSEIWAAGTGTVGTPIPPP